VTQPDRGRGRGRKRTPSPVANAALDAGLPVLRPERVVDDLEPLRALASDIGVVVAYGQFLTRRVRALPRLGYLINAHASLLPRYRGATPIAHAILEGETRTGISVMRVEREMDAGPVALVRELAIGPDETCGELTERLGLLAADAIDEALERIAADRVLWTPQDDAHATLAPKLSRDDAVLDWSQPSEALVRRIRALAPRPGAATTLEGESLRILAARSTGAIGSSEASVDEPGTGRVDDGTLRIATGSGWLVPLRVQRSGGRAMEIDAFLRGHAIADGVRLGDTLDSSSH